MNAEPAPPPALVVTAPRLPDAAGDAAFSMIAVPSDRLAGAATLDDALKSVAGFSLYRRTSTLGANPTTQGASLRAIAGSGAGRALVTLDGVPQGDPFGGWVVWSALPPSTIGQARIVRGAGAGPYGAGALTGVVSLDSRRDLEGVEGEAAVGSDGYRQATVTVGAAVTGARVLADLAGQAGDGWVPVREGRGAADRPLSLTAWSGGVRAERRAGSVLIVSRLSAYDEDRGAGQVAAGSAAKGAQVSLTATAQPGEGRAGWRVQAWASASDLYNATAALGAGRNTSTLANVQYATPALGWGVNGALRWSGQSAVELGADLRDAVGESRERFGFSGGDFTKTRKAGGSTIVAGLYVEASTGAGPWLLTGGGRIDAWGQINGERVERVIATGATTLDHRPADRSGLLPTARFGARRDLGGDWTWRTAAYAGFRPATLNELHRPFRVGAVVTEANPDLKPERLYGVETGFDLKRNALTASATLFANRLEDAVTNVTIGAGPATYPVAGFIPAGGVLRMRENAGTINATGLEAEAEQRLTRGAALSASLAWTRSTVDGGSVATQLTGKRPALTPRLTAVAGGRWAVTSTATLALNLRYESARFDDDLNTQRLRPALTADLHVDWRIGPGLGGYLAIDNLTDAHAQTAVTTDGVHSYDAPRLVRFGLRARFPSQRIGGGT